MFNAYIYSCGVQQNWIFYFMIFCDLLWFFKNSVKINIKNSKTALKPAQGGPATGFGSPRRLVGRFQSSGRKSGLGPKFREAKKKDFFSNPLPQSGEACGPIPSASSLPTTRVTENLYIFRKIVCYETSTLRCVQNRNKWLRFLRAERISGLLQN